MNEKALLFGEAKSLVGILSDPEPGTPVLEHGVIILNAGVLHRVGPNRIHVRLARALAAEGFVTLRFDFSGIGDSRQSDGAAATPGHRFTREVQQATDLLESSRGLSDFLILGICSGADNGLRAALEDPRIRGAILIDVCNVRSFGQLAFFYRGKLLNPLSWLRFLAGRSEAWSQARRLVRAHRATASAARQATPVPPSPSEFSQQIRSLLSRGTRLLLIYTGLSPAYYHYRRRLRRALSRWPNRTLVRVEYLADSDHLFTPRSSQALLIELVRVWCLGQCGRSPG